MVNNTPESKLDETVKNTLNNYEATYEPDDWSKMENMLDAAPGSSTFQWSYAIKIGFALLIIAGGYLLFNLVSAPHLKKDEIINAPPVQPSENVVKITPKLVVPTPSVTPPKVSPAEVSKEITKETALPEKIEKESPVAAKTKTEEKIISKEEKKREKKQKENAEENVIMQKTIMGNEAIFPDMLDSSKGIIGETKEKEATKKSAKEKKIPAGWDMFLPNVNPDSLKKHREKRDSLNNQ